jgi:hypothetical protein
MNSDLVILVPMLGRPHRVHPLLESIRETTPGAKIMFMVTPGDHSVRSTIEATDSYWIPVAYYPIGDYARKINTGYRNTTEPLIFTAADDLLFHPGWIEAAREKLNPGIGVVGTNDLGSPRVIAGDHSTHSLVTREYADTYGLIDQPGAILYEGYPHEWVDDELVATARHRGAWAMAHDSHVEHLHPNWGKAPDDPMYSQQRNRMMRGKRTYLRRSQLWM